MQPESGRAVPERGVGARQDSHAGPVHGADQGDAFLPQRAAYHIGIRRDAVRHREDLRHVLAQRIRQVARERIARQLSLGPRGDLELRHQCGHHPRSVAHEAREQRPQVFRRAAAQHALDGEARRQRQRLGRRARRGDLEHVFQARDPGIGRFPRRDAAGDMARHLEPALARRPGRGEVHLPRELTVQLDEVHAQPRERVHRGTGLIGRTREQVRDRHVAALDVGPRGDDARTYQSGVRDLPAPLGELRPIASQVTHAQHAVGDVEAQHLPPAGNHGVHVHVPETGHEVLPTPIHYARARRNRRGRRKTHRDDAVAAHHDGLIGTRRRRGPVDHADVGDGRDLRDGGATRRERQENPYAESNHETPLLFVTARGCPGRRAGGTRLGTRARPAPPWRCPGTPGAG